MYKVGYTMQTPSEWTFPTGSDRNRDSHWQVAGTISEDNKTTRSIAFDYPGFDRQLRRSQRRLN